jgi:hypothetical protein
MPYSQQVRAQINRNNASRSTGPQTFEGRRRSALNALCHGLTGQTVVMPSEDLEAYQRHVQSFVNEYHPQGATETQLVQSLADAAWRLNRVAALETNLLTHDIIYDDFPNHESTHEMREAIAIAAALDRHTKALANLSIHGQRLSRQFEHTLALLQKLQHDRRTGTRHQPEEPANLLQVHQMREQPYAAAAHGFVFPDDTQKRGLTTLSPTHAIATEENSTPVDRAVCPLFCASSEIEPFEYLEDRAFRASETQNHHPEAA